MVGEGYKSRAGVFGSVEDDVEGVDEEVSPQLLFFYVCR